MNDSKFSARLYLDVDGVLNADAHRAVWPDTATGLVRDRVRGVRMNVTMNWSPTLISELGSLVDELRVEVVWLTTWCDNLMIRKFEDLMGWSPRGRVAQYSANELTTDDLEWTRWKADELLRDLESDLPSIWADDDAVPLHSGRVHGAISPDHRLLMLAPDPDVGLTPDDLVQMRRFLTTPTGR